MRLLWSERAIRQLEHAVDTIAADNPAAAWRVYDRIVEKSHRLLEFPRMGKSGREADTYELVITGTKYIAVYRLVEDRIEIAAVWHGAQSRSGG